MLEIRYYYCYLYYVHETIQHNNTQHINLNTHLVAVNTLYGTSHVLYILERSLIYVLICFLDVGIFLSTMAWEKADLAAASALSLLKPIIINYFIIVHKMSNIFINSGVTLVHGISNNSTK